MNILEEEDIKFINDELAKIFINETEKQENIDLKAMQKKVKHILTQIKSAKILTDKLDDNGNAIIYWNLGVQRKRLIIEGYEIIFKFREYLTKEKINYRWYFSDKGQIENREFTENDITKYMNLGSQGLKINSELAKLDTNKVNLEYQQIVNKYLNQYTVPEENEYMKKANKISAYVVRSSIMKLYGKNNSGLYQKITNNNKKRYQTFNKGHIVEAIDTAYSALIKDNKTTRVMNKYVFGKYLARDNIKASRGGDNPFTNTSIKFGSGITFYDYTTIYNQLTLINNIISAGWRPTEENKKQFINLYLSNERLGNEFDKKAEEMVNNLLELLKNNK